jgi:CDP-glucose 4,6-dehydratase
VEYRARALEDVGLNMSSSIAVNPDFWRGRSVLVTGHTGFKGSWLCLWLQGLGAEVTGYALAPSTRPGLFEAASVAQGMRSVIGDIRDAQALRAAMVAAQPEVVLHLAAQALVRESYANPVETYSVNVVGTAQVLDTVRACPSVRAVVSVTTDKCYENREWHWGYRETDRLGGHDPYSSSKACAEMVTAAYRLSFLAGAAQSVALASARAGNVIGGGDWSANRLIPDILAAIQAGQELRIRYPDAIRPWQHVMEPLAGYLQLAERLCGDQGQAHAEAWNFGPADDDARPVRWIVEQMLARWGSGTWVVDGQPQPHEAGYLKLDCSKARGRLGWQPRWNLASALDAIVDWQRAYLRHDDMRAVTLAQIAHYGGGSA